MLLKLIFIKLILPGDPGVDLDAVEPTVDAVDTATFSISLIFNGVVTLRSTSLVGVDFLQPPCLGEPDVNAHLGGICENQREHSSVGIEINVVTTITSKS